MCCLAGFTHSAFTFGYESFVHKTDINSNDVPPGALVSFVQKGLQYLEMEANLANEVGAHVTCRSCRNCSAAHKLLPASGAGSHLLLMPSNLTDERVRNPSA